MLTQLGYLRIASYMRLYKSEFLEILLSFIRFLKTLCKLPLLFILVVDNISVKVNGHLEYSNVSITLSVFFTLGTRIGEGI